MRRFLISIIGVFVVFSAGAVGENVPTTKSYVDSAITQKQDIIEHTTGANQVLTNTGKAGEYGTKEIYDSTASYLGQTDTLIDAVTMNTAVQNAIDSEFKCISWIDDDPTKDCLLMKIRGTTSAQQPYVSATGTVVQDGTPTPDNPIEPVFYTQGNMTLRRVGDYADSYDATTHKITRRVGIKILDGTEKWSLSSIYSSIYPTFWLVPAVNDNASIAASYPAVARCSYFAPAPLSGAGGNQNEIDHSVNNTVSIGSSRHRPHTLWIRTNLYANVADFKAFLAAQYAAGTPVVIYYPLATPTEENWDERTYNQYLPAGD